MKNGFTFMLLFFVSQTVWAQHVGMSVNSSNKGKFYTYWGYNRCWFTDADIQFKGNKYDFTLKNVVAKDRQTPFSINEYFHPEKITIPQYNFRIGYFFRDHYSISIGTDHMKYVVQQNQTVKINGEISLPDSPFNGIYANDDLVLTDNFLQFEHTDGLNYGNIDVRRFDTFFAFKKVKISLTEGLGFGLLIPRTNATLLNNKRHDRFHLSGFGLNALVGLQVCFWDFVYIQSELKGGFINMPDIRTTSSKEDKASQQFLFSQSNFLVGFRFSLGK